MSTTNTYNFKLLLVIFILSISSCSQQKTNQWQVTLNKNSKEPYGCYVFYQCMKNTIAHDKIITTQNFFKDLEKEDNETYSWDKTNQLVFCVFNTFEIDSSEMDQLIRYVKKGNTVFISCYNHSKNLSDIMSIKHDDVSFNNGYKTDDEFDTIAKQQVAIEFNDKDYTFNVQDAYAMNQHYKYIPTDVDTLYSWGYSNKKDSDNILCNYIGEGKLILHRTPIALSNYFLLQNNNKEYAQYLLSNLSTGYQRKIIWYQTFSKQPGHSSDSSFSKLLKNPIIRALFLLLISTLALFVFFGSKRKQRVIPIIPPNKNDSLEYTETMGLLYYNKKNNKDLAEKIIKYYLDTLRVKYMLQTSTLHVSFADKLHTKINKPLQEVITFIEYLQHIQAKPIITDNDIITLHQQIKIYS